MDCPFWKGAFCLLRNTSYLLIKMNVQWCLLVLRNRKGLDLMKACFKFDWAGLSLPALASEVHILERSLKVMFQTEGSTNLSEPLCFLLLFMNFGTTGNTGDDVQPRYCLIQCHVSVGFWVNADVDKLLPNQLENGCWVDIFKFTIETAVSVLQKHLPLPNCVSNNIFCFLFSGFSCPVWYHWGEYRSRNGQATVKEFGTGRMRHRLT